MSLEKFWLFRIFESLLAQMISLNIVIVVVNSKFSGILSSSVKGMSLYALFSFAEQYTGEYEPAPANLSDSTSLLNDNLQNIKCLLSREDAIERQVVVLLRDIEQNF